MEQRRQPRQPKVTPPELRFTYEDRDGVRQVISAHLLDSSSGGLGIALSKHLAPGMVLNARPNAHLDEVSGGRATPVRVVVKWCTPARDHTFKAGLQFMEARREEETPRASEQVAEEPRAEDPRVAAAPYSIPPSVDYYEVLQVNPKADPETIHRVYRILAQRYHPDNRESGNEETFKLLLEAYRALSHPASRAAYDAGHLASQKARWRVFSSNETAGSVEAEKRKRLGVLGVLYRRRQQQPDQPAMPLREFEELLAVPREHLEFTLWYLRENGLVQRGDNNRFLITVKGVDYAEQHDASSGSIMNLARQLEAPQSTARTGSPSVNG